LPLFLLTLWGEAVSADVSWRKSPLAPEPERGLRLRGEARPVSRQEILRAIQDGLVQRGVLGGGGLKPDDLLIQSSVPALNGNVGLEVKRIAFDPIRRKTVFELWASREPQFLPFQVTTRRDPSSWGFTPASESNVEIVTESRGMQQRGTVRSKAPVLAKPGWPATLVMLGQNIRVTMTVVPLQPGIKGQCILVRDPDTKRVMTAEVVSEGLLQAGF
jgi:hypothetical protein